MKLLAGLLCFVFFTPLAWANPRGIKTETVHFGSKGEEVSGFLARPDSPGKHPALVVIHEWWGLVPWVKEQAEKFAAQGYVALAPDLYHGKSATDPKEAYKLMSDLSRGHGVRDVQAAYNYLASQPDVDAQKIGAVGWCMGGGYSLQLAIHEPRLAACVVNYGELPTDPKAIEQIKAHVLGNFGGLDHGITPAKVQAFEKAMKADGKNINVKIYPDANHAFENPNNKGGYRPQAARDAEARTLKFLNKNLK